MDTSEEEALKQIDDESDEDKDLTNNLLQLYSSGQIPRDPEPKEVLTRRYMYRGWDEWHEKLMHDYFLPDCVFSDENFQDRFRMPRHLVLKIIGELFQVEPQFIYQYDALNIRGHNPEQKVTSALRILGYGRPPDSNDEYLRIGKKTAYKYLSLFCETMINHFGQTYLCKPTDADVREILKQNQERGFPGMLGSLDCMHWVNFSINRINTYYLADGIYPKWSTLVQCYRQPPAGEMGRSYSYFNSRQMDLRKDVERAFEILKRKFAIICGPYRGLSARVMHKTMLTCIIMHNMVIHETRRTKNWTNHQDEDLRPEIIPSRGLPARNYAQITSHIENKTLYSRLREDLIASMWAELGRDGGQI
ncbi:uncharacterized protein LOC113305703 [Papaver somniferum]|uniref:uncharacterized protein LOC113305703 n=1 Tax=Papaver somniferum TaxID=3469 RepID=UPI000E6FBB6E|nr:uncharacterized protein LOC113305703 [Papaver somniferum]